MAKGLQMHVVKALHQLRNLLRALPLVFIAMECLRGAAMASPHGDVRRLRAEYLRLRNIDPTGDEMIHRQSWASLASQIRALVVQRRLDEESAALRILAAEAHLRVYRTTRDMSYLQTAKALIVPVAENSAVPETMRAEAVILAGDIAVAGGGSESAIEWYSRGAGFDGQHAKRAEQRLQGVRNKTFSKFIPSMDREIPRVIRDRDARARAGAGPVVVLDPGHGGSDAGAISSYGGEEKEITLDIARRVKAILERRHGIKVQLTRSDDTFVPLARRTAFANRKSGAVLVSLHVNASETHDADGLEAYYLDNTNDEASRKLAERENGILPGEALDDVSFMLSDLIQSGKLEDSIILTRAIERGIRTKVLSSHRDLRSLGVKKAPFFVLVGAHMPCSLVEMFFVDNPKEGKKLRDSSFRSALAYGIAEGISQFLTRP